MTSKLTRVKEIVRSQFWLIPALIVALSIALALFSVHIDRALLKNADTDVYWLFGGKSDAARSLLSAIATSVISVVAIAFSVTIVAIQQASSQYSPRVLRTFTADRGNQLVLGVYIGTFIYALIILRDVRASTDGAENAQFIPALSITIALALTLLSAALLVYFIHHITQLIQVDSMLSAIRVDLDQQIKRAYPNEFRTNELHDRSYEKEVRDTAALRRGTETLIKAESEGYLRIVSLDELIKCTRGTGARFVWVEPMVGDYLVPGLVLARIWSDTELSDNDMRAIRETFIIDDRPSSEQNPLFGIRQIVDVALKALSPSTNDPTTAEECLNQLKGALAKLLTREIPLARREIDGIVYLIRRPDFAEYLHHAVAQIRGASRRDQHVTKHLVLILENLLSIAPNDHRLSALRTELEATQTSLKEMKEKARAA